MKQCTSCGEVKSLEEFQNRARNKDGKTNLCKPCKRNYDNNHYANNSYRRNYITTNRKKALKESMIFIHDYLSKHPCVDCGEDDVIVLEFDHITDDKKDNIANLKRSSLKAVIEEIKKCEVRCANCHRRKTAKQFGWNKMPQ